MNDESQPLNPAILLHVKSPKHNGDVWLSPFMHELHELNDEWGMFLRLKRQEPTHFISHMDVMRQGETEWETIALKVNKPVTFGNCRVYQGSFDRENDSYSGLKVTCDPGRIFIHIGIWMFLTGAALLTVRRRLFRESVK